MPFSITRNDITKVTADAIVNTANPEAIVGNGTDSAIDAAAGKELLLAERKKIGSIEPGCAVSTKAFNLAAKYIIHTVGPRRDGCLAFQGRNRLEKGACGVLIGEYGYVRFPERRNISADQGVCAGA